MARTSSPATVPLRYASHASADIRWWCRCPGCCASTTAERDLRRHYGQWHPTVQHEPFDTSTYANSRHVLGRAYVPGMLGATAAPVRSRLTAHAPAPVTAPVPGTGSFITLPISLPPHRTITSPSAPAQVQQEEDEENNEDYDKEQLEDSGEEFNEVMADVATFGQSGPPFSDGSSRFPSRSRHGLTRQQVVVRRTEGYLGRREGDKRYASEEVWGWDAEEQRSVRLVSHESQIVREYDAELMR